MRTPASIPVMVRPWVAGLALLLCGVQLCLLWSHRDLWAKSTAWIPALSTTGFATLISLCISVLVVLCTTKLRWQDLGFTPRQLGSAAVIATSVWLFGQTVHLIDARWTGQTTATTMDISGAVLSALSEEFLFRFVAIGGAMSFAMTRVQSPHPLWWAVVASSIIFAASHIPHDVALGDYQHIERYPQLFAYGGLMALIWLQTGNLLTTALIHMLGNEPMLFVAGPHAHAITIITNWIACGVIICFSWRRWGIARRGIAQDCSES